MRSIHPRSQPTALQKLDQRTKEARLVREIRAALVKYVTGSADRIPTEVQAALIEQACQIKLRIALMDKRFTTVDQMDDGATRRYLAWSGHYARLLKQLGPGVAAKEPSLSEYLAQWRSPDASASQGGLSEAAETPSSASRSSAPAEAA